MCDKIEIVNRGVVFEDVDAIINAANASLLGGGGVDGAIHKAAGPELLTECKGLGGCETGQAKLTRGYQLPARYIIHTVGPIYRDGQHGEAELLADCYRNCLSVADKNGIHRLAFPCISTGVHGYPQEQAATIALNTILTELVNYRHIDLVRFCCFTATEFSIYNKVLDKLKNSTPGNLSRTSKPG